MECRAALVNIQLKPIRGTQLAVQDVNQQAERLVNSAPAAALGQIRVELRPHSGYSTELLRTPQGCQQLYERFGIRLLPRPRPADWSIRHTSEARCKVRRIF
jgi:hypothetical protein